VSFALSGLKKYHTLLEKILLILLILSKEHIIWAPFLQSGTIISPFQGLIWTCIVQLRATPWVSVFRPFRAKKIPYTPGKNLVNPVNPVKRVYHLSSISAIRNRYFALPGLKKYHTLLEKILLILLILSKEHISWAPFLQSGTIISPFQGWKIPYTSTKKTC
jgi:hypothetical protein